jgi:two-component system CAI-1 autoinducer sensor kinase/phosphatase CqsS
MSGSEEYPNAWPVLHGRHILIAEDEPAVRAVLRRALEMQGCVVHEAEDGRKAAEIARGAAIDLVITDLWMPGMNGVELIEALSSMECPAEVIVLSAHIASATTEKLRRLGVFRILKKPTGIAALLEVVQAGLSSDRRGRLADEFAEGHNSGAGDGPTLVLIADDDAEVRGLLGTILASAGYRVEEARDGEEAVEKALAHDVGIVLTDLNMPRMNGQEVVSILRRAGTSGHQRSRHEGRASRDCFIVCMTGECNKREMDAALRAGAASCFRKPFDTAEILAEVKRLEAISLHRRRLAARERALTARLSLPERVREFIGSVRHGYGRRLKWVAAAAVAIVALSAVAVPLASSFLGRASRAARNAGRRVDDVLESASRVEGYLQRDEARELRR